MSKAHRLVLPAAFAALALGTWLPIARPAAAAPPPFRARVLPVTAALLPHSWRPGCPVPPSQLRLVRVAHWGFDGERRLGSIVVRDRVAAGVVSVFRRLYRARFPIRRLQPIDAFRGDDGASTAADNTSGFNCRAAVASGPRRWSAHAYGEAIDVNPRENPYLLGGRVLPPGGRAFLDRSRMRPGMAVEGGILVRAFAAAGWSWGGRWSSPDYQHFSTSGR